MTNTSMPKVYCINFWAEGVNLAALQQYLHDSADVVAYWNYIPLVYCIKSRLSATELTVKLRPFFPRPFMVAEINVWNLDGVVHPAAWEWFYLNHHEKHRPPAPPVAGFGDLGLLGSHTAGGLAAGLAGFLSPPSRKD